MLAEPITSKRVAFDQIEPNGRYGRPQVAKIFGVNIRTLDRWMKVGGFPEPIRISQRAFFWTGAMLLDFLRERGGSRHAG